MTGIHKEPGPAARRVAAAIRRFRRADWQDITTAELSRRLTELGQPIPDTGITKTEQGTRRVDVDDLVAISLALAVTPNALLLPPVDFLGATDVHRLTPAAASGTPEELWVWAQGEKPVPVLAEGAWDWLGKSEYPSLEFAVRNRPYLTALHPPGSGEGGGELDTVLREVSAAVTKAMHAGASASQVRRVIELSIVLPVLMTRGEIRSFLEDGTRPDGGGR